MAEIINNELRITGISGKVYTLFIHPIPLNVDIPQDFAMLYIYLYYDGSNLKLIYCGKDEYPPKRLKEHKKDKCICNNSNYIALCYYNDLELLDKVEVDILEGNKFECNIQHNTQYHSKAH